jgi:hypothetical protein
LLASDLRVRRVINPGPRDLRCDQKCRHHGGQAYQSEKLIHRKHRHRPQGTPRQQKAASIRSFCNLLRARHKLIGVNRPGNREQRQNRNDDQGFHRVNGRFGLWRKTSKLGAFSGRSREKSWQPHGDTCWPAGQSWNVPGMLVQAVFPASIVNTAPVTLRPPSPSRYSTMRATSSGWVSRRKALRPAMRWR